MTKGRDDDALSWGGDDDPTLDLGASADPDDKTDADADAADEAETDATPELPEGFTAVGRGSETVAAAAAAGAAPTSGATTAERGPMGNGELIGVGVLGGVYALFAIGWIIGGLRLQGTAAFLVSPVGYQVSLWLAILAPVVWFATVFALTARSRAWVRLTWLVAGAVLLLPWPFIMLGAIGQ
ncbi:DNA polymerase III subunit gamma/tau [Microbacterium jejuense]|uniref:DNA polymerase III subunit gamma/tau n=1 Tax=Microbacterium jejuense TaxID=1263637 RepID=UPI0031E7E0A2